jgi:excisionase family DNA binding protein
MSKSAQQQLEWVSPMAFAAHYGISAKTVYSLLRSGKLRGVRFGKTWRLPLDQEARDA